MLEFNRFAVREFVFILSPDDIRGYSSSTASRFLVSGIAPEKNPEDKIRIDGNPVRG